MDGPQETPCPYLPSCPFMHNVEEFISKETQALCTYNANCILIVHAFIYFSCELNFVDKKPEDVKKDCYTFLTYGKCPRGLTCRFLASHIDNGRNLINEDLWAKMKPIFEQTHGYLIPKAKQIALRKHQYDFTSVEKVLSSLPPTQAMQEVADVSNGSSTTATTDKVGPVSDEDTVPLRPNEVKKVKLMILTHES